MDGGFVESTSNDSAGLTKISGWKGLVEAKAGTEYASFEPVHYTTQVVAGTNYKAKVKVSDSEYIHILVFEGFSSAEPTVMSVESGKTLEEALN
ncbi:unnamed protein product [Moneuplotes crassus]|uniref:Cystatin domain-containing protein n=1 Tax=Euplotes crassus TaxID=5936 RepID=A0AAD2DB15_EUPCR|nr:unnamed protein product [Moneuplotes crassus]